MTTALLDSEIVYSRLDKCYDLFVAGVLVACAPTYGGAEAKRTHILAERRDEGLYATASDPDGGCNDPPAGSDDEDTTGLGDRDSEGDDPDARPNPGRAIARMWHKQPRDFIAVLSQLDSGAWLTLAAAYAEWRDSYLTTSDVLNLWANAVEGTTVVPANARS